MNISINYSVSKARDTYGYNRVQVVDLETGKKYATVGGGYDMTGSAIGMLLSDKLQSVFVDLQPKAHTVFGEQISHFDDGLYGLSYSTNTERYSIDGSTGIRSIELILKAIGYKLRAVNQLNSKGRYVKTLGYNLEKIA